MEIQDFFDLSKLDKDKLGHLMFVLNSPSYIEVFEPYLKTMRNSMNTLLLHPTKERRDRYPDDFLIGGINTIDGLLTLFKKAIEETDINKMHESQTKNLPQDVAYQILREEGKIRPVSGIGHIVEEKEYKPEEDY